MKKILLKTLFFSICMSSVLMGPPSGKDEINEKLGTSVTKEDLGIAMSEPFITTLNSGDIVAVDPEEDGKYVYGKINGPSIIISGAVVSYLVDVGSKEYQDVDVENIKYLGTYE